MGRIRATGAGVLRAATVTDAAGLAALELEWRALAQACPTATVFQTWEWNAAWWRHYGRGRRLCLWTWRRDDGSLAGLAPLAGSFWYGTPLRRLAFLGEGVSDYGDLLAAPGAEAEVAGAFYRTLAAAGGWQVADLRHLREEALLRAYPPPPETGLACRDVPEEACPFLALPADWDMLLRGLGKKTRSNIGYYDRSLQKVYHVDWGAVQDEATLDEEMTRLFELHQRRWNKRWLPGVLGGTRVRRFHRDAARVLLRQGWLRLFYLRLDQETQASLYCFAFGNRVCYYQGGFEPDLARLSLGTVLTARAIRASVEEGRAVFDFLRGDEPYKAKWTGSAQINTRRLLTRQGSVWSPLAGRVQRLEQTVEERVKAWARRGGTAPEKPS